MINFSDLLCMQHCDQCNKKCFSVSFIYSGTYNKGPSEKGTNNLSTKDTSIIPTEKCICNSSQLPKRGQSPYKGQNGWFQSVLYSEVPTIASFS